MDIKPLYNIKKLTSCLSLTGKTNGNMRGKIAQLLVGVLAAALIWSFSAQGAWARDADINSVLSILNDTFGDSGQNQSNTIGAALNNLVLSVYSLPALISGFAYLGGLLLGVQAIFKVRDHVMDPHNTPISEPIKRFLVGGGLFSLPIVIQAAYNTIVGGLGGAVDLDFFGGFISVNASARAGGLEAVSQTAFTGSTSGRYGLDAILVRLMRDVWNPMHAVINAFAYLAGLVFIVIGITRLLKSAQDGPQGPAGTGTIMTFIIAGVFFALSPVMGAFSQSLFGTTVISNGVVFASGGEGGGSQTIGLGNVLSATALGHVQAVISGVLAFLIVIGWISFVRGWWLLRDFAESGGQGQGASLMACLTHIFGGALLVNMGPLLNIVQTTLGLTRYGFIFV